MLFIEPVLRAVCDRRERDKFQETLSSVTRFKQPVSQRATTKLRDKLQEKLPSVTAPLHFEMFGETCLAMFWRHCGGTS